MTLPTCISPKGRFIFGLHQHRNLTVANLRANDDIAPLGNCGNQVCFNQANFPDRDTTPLQSDPVYEIRNAFPFWGTTYIGKKWADACARKPAKIEMPAPQPCSLSKRLQKWLNAQNVDLSQAETFFDMLPEPLLLALATTSTDPRDLTHLARRACDMILDPVTGQPTGMRFDKSQKGQMHPKIHNEALFEAVANNTYLPDKYKEVMVLRPGVQGASAIVGDWVETDTASHIYEYIRGNSYIPFGHYAANMADDAVRYRIKDLTSADMVGLRHLYYQRTYLRLADQLNLKLPALHQRIPVSTLENLRYKINEALASSQSRLLFNGSLWGWNFGFDYAPTHYRLHASHQQIHQQFALIPALVPDGAPSHCPNKPIPNHPAFGFGDMIASFGREFYQETGRPFFESYLKALGNNQRMDGADPSPADLTVYADPNVILFTPKAQTSQWELQLMTLPPIGNILEADTEVRASLDRAMLIAVQILEKMGARMITCIEASKRFDDPDTDQRLLYFFLPKTPQSPISFTQAQLRWINGHYPEDFAAACRARLG